MDIIKAIILGIVEGITEFLPISSTGHLIIVNQFIDFKGDFAKMFDVVIQLGAILSVVVYFRSKLFPFQSGKTKDEKKEIWDIWVKVIVAVIPALIIGAIFAKKIHLYLFSPVTVSIALIVGGIILILIEIKMKRKNIDAVQKVSYFTAFFIGCFQCLAMIPGTSRAAATIIGAMLLGLTRKNAAEFSFFLAIPTMVAASAYSLYKTGFKLTGMEWVTLATGFIVSFLVAWVVIAGFMKFIQRKDFTLFGYYRIVLGIFVLLYFTLKVA